MTTRAFLPLTVLTALLLCLAACKKEEGAPAAAKTVLPPALLVDGAPVDVMCFSDIIIMNEPQQEFPVKGCGAGLVTKERRAEDEGRVQFASYRFEGDNDGSMGMPYTQYKYIGQSGPSSVVLLTWSGGGTGHFSTVMLLSRAGETLKIDTLIPGGDRCNGGIGGVSVDSAGVISLGKAVTPYDLLVLGGDPQRESIKNVKAYDDLEACAACCYGAAKYTGTEFTGISLSADLGDSIAAKTYDNPEAPEHRKQQCFDRLLLAHTGGGKLEFTPSEWAGFISGVEQECLGNAAGEE